METKIVTRLGDGSRMEMTPSEIRADVEDGVAESVAEVYDHRDEVKGLKMVYEPPQLRFFQARFEPLA